MAKAQDRASAFKVGFLRKLAELGVTPDEFMVRVKRANLDDLPNAALGGAVDVGKSAIGAGLDAAGTGLKTLGYASVLAPLLLGGASGALTGHMDAPTSKDVEALRQEELLSLYERLTREVAERRARRAVAA